MYKLGVKVKRAGYFEKLAIAREIAAIKNCQMLNFRPVGRNFLRNVSVHRAQMFRDNWNCFALSIFSDLILIAWSGNETGMLIRQKNLNEDSPIVSITFYEECWLLRYELMIILLLNKHDKVKMSKKIMQCRTCVTSILFADDLLKNRNKPRAHCILSIPG